MAGSAGAAAALWWAVVVSGLYHGVNPGMGWPLAVSAGLMDDRRGALARALAALALGHFVAMSAVLLPFSLMTALVERQREIRVGAGLLVMAMGFYLLVNRRHPRFLARIAPRRLAFWSFLAATAHGAGLMLAPIYLGICGPGGAGGDAAAERLIGANVLTAFAVAAVHTLATLAGGAALAVATYRWFGPRFLSRSWFNLDLAWALSLVLVGAFGVYAAYGGH